MKIKTLKKIKNILMKVKTLKIKNILMKVKTLKIKKHTYESKNI
jgi:hypothetical protein